MKRSTMLTLAAVASLCLAAGACGGDDDDGASSAEPAVSTSVSEPASDGTSEPLVTQGTTGSSVTSATGELNAPEKVTIGVGGIQGVAPWAPHLAARGLGLFDELAAQFGTEFEFADMDSGSQVAMLDSGNIQVLLSSPPAYSVARAQGVDLEAFLQMSLGGNIALVGASAHEAEFGDDLSKYADATWGYTAPGSSTEAWAITAAQDAGLEWSNLDTVSFGQVSAALPALEAGRLDVISIDVGTAGRAVADGVGYVAYNSNNDTDVIGTIALTTPDWAAEYPELIRAIASVYQEAMAAVQSAATPADVLAMFPQEYQESMAEGWDESWALTLPGQVGTGEFVDANLDATIAFLVGSGYIEEASADVVRSGMNNSILDS